MPRLPVSWQMMTKAVSRDGAGPGVPGDGIDSEHGIDSESALILSTWHITFFAGSVRFTAVF